MLVAYNNRDKEVQNGDLIQDHRGTPAIFVCATRARISGKSGKVVVKYNPFESGTEYYDNVFSLRVREV